MVYVVERYLPGLCRADLLPGLSKLEPVIEELWGEGSVVSYLGSTIVLGDEACFCQFDGPSEAAVAEANRRAGLPFDRIVPALLVDSHQRRSDMSVSTSIPQTARLGRFTRLVIVAAVAAVIVVVAWAIATSAAGPSSRPTKHTASDSSVRARRPHDAGAAVRGRHPLADPGPVASSVRHRPALRRYLVDEVADSERTPLRAVDLVDELFRAGRSVRQRQVSGAGAGVAQRS